MNKTILAISITALLSACGGGGGSSTTPTPTPPAVEEPIVVDPPETDPPEPDPKEATDWVFMAHDVVYRDWDTSPSNVYNYVAMDVNGDELLDIVTNGPYHAGQTWSPNETKINVLVNQGDYTMQLDAEAMFGDNEVPGQVHTREIEQADFDGNGILDVLMISHGWDIDPFPGEPLQLLMGHNGIWSDESSALNYDVASFYHAGSTIDVNGDGHTDILAASLQPLTEIDGRSIRSVILVNDGTGEFVQNYTYLNEDYVNFSAVTAEAGDLDNDSCDDILYASGGELGQANTVMWNMCGELGFTDIANSTELPRPADASWTLVTDATFSDIDGDGHVDLLLAFTSDYDKRYIQVLLNNGDRTFSDATDTLLSASFNVEGVWISRLFVEDLDNDGDKDLVVMTDHMYPTTFNSVVLENVDTVFTPIEATTGVGALFPIDIDNDNDIDLVSITRTEQRVLENLTVK